MKVLIGCEYSGRVRDAFTKKGHDATSCDLRPSETPGKHRQCDLLTILDEGWDLMIAHPYCTFNNLAGIRWMYHPDDTALPPYLRRRHPQYPNRMDDFQKGIQFFIKLMNAPIPKIALENSQPHGLAMAHIGHYDQKVQPWHFGDGVTKAACLWLKGLPLLKHTHTRRDYDMIRADCHLMSPGPNREKERSRTSHAIANAMAEQWGGAL